MSFHLSGRRMLFCWLVRSCRTCGDNQAGLDETPVRTAPEEPSPRRGSPQRAKRIQDRVLVRAAAVDFGNAAVYRLFQPLIDNGI